MFDLEAMFGSLGNPDEAKLESVIQKLFIDAANKGYAEIQKYIDSNFADPSRKFEAQAFVRIFLRDASYLHAKVAEELGMPQSIGVILAEKCMPLLNYAVNEGAKDSLNDPNVQEALARNAVPSVPLTNDERTKLEAEAIILKEKLSCPVMNAYDEMDKQSEANPEPPTGCCGQGCNDHTPPTPKNWKTLPPDDPMGAIHGAN